MKISKQKKIPQIVFVEGNCKQALIYFEEHMLELEHGGRYQSFISLSNIIQS